MSDGTRALIALSLVLAFLVIVYIIASNETTNKQTSQPATQPTPLEACIDKYRGKHWLSGYKNPPTKEVIQLCREVTETETP